jgi:predicted phage tail protein
MKKVFLHGELGNKFGKEWNLEVRSPFEALSALFANNPKIEKYLHKKESDGIYYGIKKIAKGDFLKQNEASLKTDSDIHFIPIPKGAGFAGTLAMTALTTAASVWVQKKMSENMNTRNDQTLQVQTQSFLYGGGSNRYKQGSTVPLGYGKMKVGTNVISSSVVNYEYDSEKGKIFNFDTGLYSLIPSYNQYHIEELGVLFSSFLINLFDGSSKFRTSDPLYRYLKEKLPDTHFGSNDGLFGGFLDIESQREATVGDTVHKEGNKYGGYYYYNYNWFKGIGAQNIEKIGTILTEGNWRPEQKTADDGFKVSAGDAYTSSFVCLQSVPILSDVQDAPDFYPISFAGESENKHIEDKAVPHQSVRPLLVGQRFRNGSKENGVGWFKLESASIYKAVDLICEGSIDGLCDKNGEKLKFNKNVELVNDPNNPKFYRNPDDDYLQAIFLDGTPVKEVNLNTNKDSYNINEFDVDIAQNNDEIIGSNDQGLLEPQYLFTANTTEINEPLYGPREINLNTIVGNVESVKPFEKGKPYEKGDYVSFEDNGEKYLYRIDYSLNNEFNSSEDNSSKIIHIKEGETLKFYETTDELNQFVDFNSKEQFAPGDKVKSTDPDGQTRYYLMGSDAPLILGKFDDTKSYTNQQGNILLNQGATYKITGDYNPSNEILLNEFASPVSVTIEAENDDEQDKVHYSPTLYVLKNSDDSEISSKDWAVEQNISPQNTPNLFQSLEINGVKDIKNGATGPGEQGQERQDLVEKIFYLAGDADQEEIRKTEEEYYASHTIINPLVEEAYVTLQLNELQYIYEGDSIDVTYQIGDFWTDLIDIIGAYKIAKSVVQGVRTATASQPFTAAMIPGIIADVATDTGFWIGVAALIGNHFLKKARFKLGEKIENSGETWPNKARFRIKYGNEGETPYFTDVYIYGVATSPYRKDVKIYLPKNPSQKDRFIKVYKLNRERNPVKEGEQAARYRESMSLAAVTEISPVHLNYPNSVVVGTRINARDVGSIPTRNYHIRMKKVAVPSNYNPETRHYDGNWDGKFFGQSEVDGEVPEASKMWTDNPAWCMYDLISSKKYGVGKFGLEYEHIDKWTLYKIAKYCDEFVPTGYSSKYNKRSFSAIGDKTISIEVPGSYDDADFKKEFSHINKKLAIYYDHGIYESIKIESVSGSDKKIILAKNPMQQNGVCAVEIDYPLVETRYTLNAFLMNSQNAFKLINEFASIFRSYAYWSGGTINFFQDQKKESVMLFSNNNVSEEGFIYSNTPKTSRVNSCKIKYLDRYNMYRPKMEHSEDRKSIQDNNILEKTLDGFGITSQSQAKRAADFLVKSSNMETETISFRTSSLGSYLRPGDVIDVLDSKRTIGRFAGKVIDVTVQGDAKSAEIKLDYPINSVIDPDDSSTWKKISLYYTSGNETIQSINEIGVPTDQEIDNMRASQIKEFTVVDLYENDTKVKIVPESPYSFISGEYNWVEALIDSENRSGVLATIEDDADQALVAAVLPKNEMAWIGGHYITEPEPAKFIWHQSEDCDNNEIKYFDWADDQPTNLINEDEKYISVTGSFRPEEHGDWVTLSGDTEQGYILEKQADDSLFGLRDIEGSTFILEDKVNFAVPKQYKIINIKEMSNGTFEIQGMQYNHEKFDNIEKELSMSSPKSPVIFTEQNIDAPEGVTLEMLHDDPGNFVPYGLKSSWEMVLAAATYKVQYFNENILLATFEIDNDKNSAIINHEYRSEKIFENGNYYVRVYSIPA